MTITDSMVLQFRSIGKVPRTTVPPAVYSQRLPNMDRPMRLIVLSLLLSAVSAAPLMAAETAPPAAASPLAIGETFTIESKALGETRRINVYRPQPWGLDPKAPLPVLYMPDGGIGEDFLHVAGLVQVLSGNGSMRPFLLVGIENTERRRDMTGPSKDPQDQKIAPRIGGSAARRPTVPSCAMN